MLLYETRLILQEKRPGLEAFRHKGLGNRWGSPFRSLFISWIVRIKSITTSPASVIIS